MRGRNAARVHFGLTRESAREWMCLEDAPIDSEYDEEMNATRVKFDEETNACTIEIPEYAAQASAQFVLWDAERDAYDEPSG